ncbi:hypothetical protein RJ639_044807 [Escallonia herrerae]|uniref:DUF659 domain-containing protein n=1 Tax=Escallonia herrerae TaxID=1293975 RepID=A0AA88WC82_9ASTE|nr:hypothetical protein RJ639_044807 [Escallonia herrerae]
MKQLLEGFKKAKARKEKLNVNIGYGDCVDVDDDSEDVAVSADSVGNAGKKKGKEVAVASKRKKGPHPSIKSAMTAKEIVDNANLAVAQLKAPSFFDLRGNLLRTLVDEISTYLDKFRPIWELYGCFVMSDGWSNRRQEPVINFLVYCLKGTMFLKSIDASSLTKDVDTLYGIFKEGFITDNEAAYKAAGKSTLHIYLMLENLADVRHFPTVDATFIYNHGFVVNMMRKEFTNGRELCRPGITRFVTNFLSLQCLLKFKKELRQMFTCDKWLNSKLAKSVLGKEVGN